MRRERREEVRCGGERGRSTEQKHGEKQNYRQKETEEKNLRHLKDQRQKRAVEIQQGKYTGGLKGHMRRGKNKTRDTTRHDTKTWKSNTRNHKTKPDTRAQHKEHESKVMTDNVCRCNSLVNWYNSVSVVVLSTVQWLNVVKSKFPFHLNTSMSSVDLIWHRFSSKAAIILLTNSWTH